jgi:nucleoid-associated protein YgaU
LETSKIGIKIADGTFYPVLEEGSKEKKRLVLTTVKDNQEQVQIDLYRGQEKSLENADYIGSLMIEDIPPSPKGEPEVEVILGVDEEGNLNAVATESKSGNRQSLSTSLATLDKEGAYRVPEFELDQDLEAESLFEEEEDLTGTTYPIGPGDRRKDLVERKRSPWLRLVFVLLGLLIIAGLTFLVFQLFGLRATGPPIEVGKRVEQVEEKLPAEAVPPKEAEKPQEAAKGQTPSAAEPAATTAEKKTTQDTSEGVWYSIKWGDTLWDISAKYYRNPWNYYKIARHPRNSIKNPDYIIAGYKLFIPKN